MISYPVDPDTRWAVMRLSTGEIISRNSPWPRADGAEIQGLDPDFVYLRHVDDTRPDYDGRLYSLETTETPDAVANEIRKSYRTVKRPADEQKTAAENTEAEKLAGFFNMERLSLELLLTVAALLSYSDGLQMPARVQAFTDKIKAKGVKVWKNRDRLEAIIAEIDAGTEPDLDAGWETPDVAPDDV